MVSTLLPAATPLLSVTLRLVISNLPTEFPGEFVVDAVSVTLNLPTLPEEWVILSGLRTSTRPEVESAVINCGCVAGCPADQPAELILCAVRRTLPAAVTVG